MPAHCRYDGLFDGRSAVAVVLGQRRLALDGRG